ncbi:MAG: DUF3365 domain-containing protein [Pseudomonadales bacterium]
MRRFLLAAALSGMVVPGAGAGVADDRLDESRAIALEFQKTLGGALKLAMADGGPVSAISVCAEVAPAIAARMSAETGATVSRTALRVRNPENAPDADAVEVLEQFRARIAAAEPGPIEHLGPNGAGGTRYLRAIPLDPLCVACHGAVLAPDVAAAVAARYPDDRATGFEPGELRGAFLIDWPASAETAP